MSSKSTVILLPCVHIYEDVNYEEDEKRTLAISVYYDEVDDENFLEVDAGSQFAKLMRYLLKDKTEEELIKAINEPD